MSELREARAVALGLAVLAETAQLGRATTVGTVAQTHRLTEVVPVVVPVLWGAIMVMVVPVLARLLQVRRLVEQVVVQRQALHPPTGLQQTGAVQTLMEP
jgi:hypothetical protein